MSNSPSAGGASRVGAAVWSSVGAAADGAGACSGSTPDSPGASAGVSAVFTSSPKRLTSHK